MTVNYPAARAHLRVKPSDHHFGSLISISLASSKTRCHSHFPESRRTTGPPRPPRHAMLSLAAAQTAPPPRRPSGRPAERRVPRDGRRPRLHRRSWAAATAAVLGLSSKSCRAKKVADWRQGLSVGMRSFGRDEAVDRICVGGGLSTNSPIVQNHCHCQRSLPSGEA